MKSQAILSVILVGMFVLSAFTVAALDRSRATSIAEELKASDVRNLDEALARERILDSYEATENIVREAEEANVRINRFLLWTHNGEDVMWGTYANGYFFGEDNHGKETWGIYHKGVFAGFYDGEFFYGKYRGKFWKAEGLFGKDSAWGMFVTFPGPRPVPVDSVESVDAEKLDNKVRPIKRPLNQLSRSI